MDRKHASRIPPRETYLSFEPGREPTFDDLIARAKGALAEAAGKYATPSDRRLYEFAQDVLALVNPLEARFNVALHEAARARTVVDEWDAAFGRTGATPREVLSKLRATEARLAELEAQLAPTSPVFVAQARVYKDM